MEQSYVREYHAQMRRLFKRLRLKPGDIYEDCNFHPVVCLGVNYKADEIWGASMIDGTHPRTCSLSSCGVRKLSIKQAWQIKISGPLAAEDRERISQERRWWNTNGVGYNWRIGLVGPQPKKE